MVCPPESQESRKSLISRNDFLHELSNIAVLYKASLLIGGKKSVELQLKSLRRSFDLFDILVQNIDKLPDEFEV